MKIPKICVVMPVYNCDDYIELSIDSILQQTLQDFEFIIINDGSTDKTADIVRSFKDSRIRFFDYKVNMKIPRRRNEAIKYARAPLIAIHDGDDISLSDRLEMQFRAMFTHEELFCVGGLAKKIDNNGDLIDEIMDYPPTEHDECVSMVLNKCMNPMIDPTVMFRKRQFDELGGYTLDPTIYTVPDFDLWLRAMEKGMKFGNLNMPLIQYRENPEGMTRQKQTEMMKAHMIVWNRFLRSQRPKEDYSARRTV